MKNLTVRSIVSVKFTADQWELFDDDGRDAAAAALNSALEAAVNAENSTPASVYAAMQPVQHQYAELGADDGEAGWLIDKVAQLTFKDE